MSKKAMSHVHIRVALLLICLLITVDVSAENMSDGRKQFLDIAALEHANFPKNSVKKRYFVSVSNLHREFAKNKYRIELEQRDYNIVLAKDGDNYQTISGLVTVEIPYKETSMLLAVILSDELRVQRVAVVSVDKKYVDDFKSSIGVGVIKRYTMTSLRQLKYLASEIKKQGALSELVSAEIAMMAATLASEMRK